jgi:hypothetical protein
MTISPKRSMRIFNKLSFSVILVLPILLYLVPLDWFNKQHTTCLFKNIFGIDCYGCGITRAVLSALHFNFEDAINYNIMVVIVLPLLIYIWIRITISLYNKTGCY